MSQLSQSDLSHQIAAASVPLGVAVGTEALPGLAAYATSLWAWNAKLNLTRHTDVEKFVSRDVADAVAIASYLDGSRSSEDPFGGEHILDVGTGGGVPGVLLAILRPQLRVELAESVAKRARAVRDIIEEIGLSIPVHEGPAQRFVAESFANGDRFDTLVVRAVAPLLKLLQWFEPLCDAYGRILIVKGPRWETEKGEARHHGFVKKVTVRRVASWPIRGSDNESVLLEVRKRPLSG